MALRVSNNQQCARKTPLKGSTRQGGVNVRAGQNHHRNVTTTITSAGSETEDLYRNSYDIGTGEGCISPMENGYGCQPALTAGEADPGPTSIWCPQVWASATIMTPWKLLSMIVFGRTGLGAQVNLRGCLPPTTLVTDGYELLQHILIPEELGHKCARSQSMGDKNPWGRQWREEWGLVCWNLADASHRNFQGWLLLVEVAGTPSVLAVPLICWFLEVYEVWVRARLL